MKKFTILLGVLLSFNVLATETKLSSDASDLASILLNPQLSECVKQFQAESPVIVGVSKEENGEVEIVRVNAWKLVGGDVASGTITMTINTEYVPSGLGFNVTPVHTCRVDVKLND